MERKKLQTWLPLLFSITMIAGMFIGFKMRDGLPGQSFFKIQKRSTIMEVLELVKNKYVEDIPMKSLEDTAIEAILSKLDPHSVLIPADKLQELNDDITGEFYGIGVEYSMINDTINVISLVQNGPSTKAGIQIGDKLIRVGEKLVAGVHIDSKDVRKLLRGNRGEKIDIYILRDTVLKRFTIARDAVPLSSVDAGYMIEKGIGYIRLNKFSLQTYREFMEALVELKKQGLQKLILDLRGNGGGILDEAIEIADEFLQGDKLITFTEGKNYPKKEYRCRREGQFETGELVIMADEGTASASEVLMGALQDWDRATIIGRRSFGKGLVQEQFDLSDNSAVRLTIAKYYTPLGRSIQRSYRNGQEAYFNDISNRILKGEPSMTDSSKKANFPVFTTQSGKKVYGGGGITPDIIFTIDSNDLNNRKNEQIFNPIASKFSYAYYLKHKNISLQYKTVDDFSRNFDFDENDWLNINNLVKTDSLSKDIFPKIDKASALLLMKANLARLVWHLQGFYVVSNFGDKEVKNIIEKLKK